MNLPPKSRSPKRLPSRRLSAAVLGAANTASLGRQKDHVSNVNSIQDRALQEIQPPQLNDWKELLLSAQKETISPRSVSWPFHACFSAFLINIFLGPFLSLKKDFVVL